MLDLEQFYTINKINLNIISKEYYNFEHTKRHLMEKNIVFGK